MECYETLTDRRRKKSAKNPSRRQKPSSNAAAMLLDKSLPSLPSNVTPDASSGDRDTPPSEIPPDHTLMDPAPRRMPSNARPGSSRGTQRERSPAALEDPRKGNIRTSPLGESPTDWVQRILCYHPVHIKVNAIQQSPKNPTVLATKKKISSFPWLWILTQHQARLRIRTTTDSTESIAIQ